MSHVTKPTVVVLVHQIKDPVADLRRRHADVIPLEFEFVNNLHKITQTQTHTMKYLVQDAGL